MSAEKIDVKNLTWQQVCLCLGLMIAVMGAYKLFGELPAGVLLVLSSITNLLLGRTSAVVPELPASKGGDK